jgi:hypothetical protein
MIHLLIKLLLQFMHVFMPLISYSLRICSETHTASYPIGTRGESRGGKDLGHEADYSLPSSAEVKNGGIIPPFLYVFLA